MILIRVESQMRAGTHYLLDALAQAYQGVVYFIRDRQFHRVSPEELSEGLYSRTSWEPRARHKALIFHNHYFHDLPKRKILQRCRTIYLIGFPLDSFYSDGLVFSEKEYSVRPSLLRKQHGSYKLKKGSREWQFLEPYMVRNARWLEGLATATSRPFILRYEDFFTDFTTIKKRIQELVGPFVGEFPRPRKNPARMYWTDAFLERLDRDAFVFLFQLFEKSLAYFYPEKYEVLLKQMREVAHEVL